MRDLGVDDQRDISILRILDPTLRNVVDIHHKIGF